jgi:hypothetical protein
MKYFVFTFFLAIGMGLALAVDEAPEDPTELEVAKEMTEEEVAAELQRIEDALGENEDLKEFVPSKPLAADLPIDLPSDI